MLLPLQHRAPAADPSTSSPCPAQPSTKRPLSDRSHSSGSNIPKSFRPKHPEQPFPATWDSRLTPTPGVDLAPMTNIALCFLPTMPKDKFSCTDWDLPGFRVFQSLRGCVRSPVLSAFSALYACGFLNISINLHVRYWSSNLLFSLFCLCFHTSVPC